MTSISIHVRDESERLSSYYPRLPGRHPYTPRDMKRSKRIGLKGRIEVVLEVERLGWFSLNFPCCLVLRIPEILSQSIHN